MTICREMYMNKICTEGPTSLNHHIEVVMYIIHCVYTIEKQPAGGYRWYWTHIREHHQQTNMKHNRDICALHWASPSLSQDVCESGYCALSQQKTSPEILGAGWPVSFHQRQGTVRYNNPRYQSDLTMFKISSFSLFNVNLRAPPQIFLPIVLWYLMITLT